MRKLTRRPLSARALTLLARRTERVRVAPNDEARVAEIDRLWKQQSNRAFQEIRETLAAMASGLARCMYCEDSQGTDIEHFRPRRQYPEHAFDWSNYLLACSHCNSNQKRDQFPLDEHGQPLLIDPTAENPGEHLVLTPSSGKFQNRTPMGEASIRVFGLDRDLLEKGRKSAWDGLVLALIPRYAEARRRGDAEATQRLLETICKQPFSSVLWHLLRVARMPGAARLLRADCLSALRELGDDIARAAGFTD
jgi:uncharacterized protein (TIGR02646 family)